MRHAITRMRQGHTMPIPPRRPTPASAKPPPARVPTEDELQEAEEDVPDYLMTGGKAETAVKESAQARGSAGFEFFITTKEMDAAKKRGENGVTVRVHFIRNYADTEEKVSVPRCTIKENGRFASYTSPGNDCALAAAGVNVSIRPVYLLVDHRSYKRQDGSVSKDQVKFWIPSPPLMAIMDAAIANLCENTGEDPKTIDIRKYEAKITKIGEGRNTAWSIDFVVRPTGLSQEAIENVKKFYGDLSYRQKLGKLLAPNPRYMLSRGGSYVKPSNVPQGGGAADGDEPPF
jgi:hypothetical protein